MRNLEKKITAKADLIRKLSVNIETLTAKKAELEKTITEKLQTEENIDKALKLQVELGAVAAELDATQKLLDAKKAIPAFTFEELKAEWEKKVPIINKDLEKQEEKFQAACDTFMKAFEDYSNVYVGYLTEIAAWESLGFKEGYKGRLSDIRVKITSQVRQKIQQMFKIDAAGAQARGIARAYQFMD